MKPSYFWYFSRITSLLFPTAFFESSRARIFLNGSWKWQTVPGFDTAIVKSGSIPIEYYVFCFKISGDNYYLLELLTCLSVLLFAFYCVKFCVAFVGKHWRATYRAAYFFCRNSIAKRKSL